MLHEQYRPPSLDGIFGQDAALAQVARITSRKGFKGGAVMFAGPSGSGKTTLAKALAMRYLTDPRHLDVIDSRTCDIDALRRLEVDAAHSTLWGGDWKVYLIDEAHSMTPGAQEYALGLLERLPKHRLILGTTTETPTFGKEALNSRWLTVKLDRPDTSVIVARLRAIAEAESITLPPDIVLADAIRRRQNNFRTCITDIIEAGCNY